jgi:hypothetical protein
MFSALSKTNKTILVFHSDKNPENQPVLAKPLKVPLKTLQSSEKADGREKENSDKNNFIQRR